MAHSRGLREERKAVADHREGADLVEHGDDQDADRGVDSAHRVGQPGVSGHSGAFTAKAKKKPRNRIFCVLLVHGEVAERLVVEGPKQDQPSQASTACWRC